MENFIRTKLGRKNRGRKVESDPVVPGGFYVGPGCVARESRTALSLGSRIEACMPPQELNILSDIMKGECGPGSAREFTLRCRPAWGKVFKVSPVPTSTALKSIASTGKSDLLTSAMLSCCGARVAVRKERQDIQRERRLLTRAESVGCSGLKPRNESDEPCAWHQLICPRQLTLTTDQWSRATAFSSMRCRGGVLVPGACFGRIQCHVGPASMWEMRYVS